VQASLGARARGSFGPVSFFFREKSDDMYLVSILLFYAYYGPMFY